MSEWDACPHPNLCRWEAGCDGSCRPKPECSCTSSAEHRDHGGTAQSRIIGGAL